MNNSHKVRVKDYLLGTLADEQARALEEEYFTNRSSLLEIQNAETAMIGDFLAGRLMPRDRELFERRCLQLPDLQRRVDDFRRQMPLRDRGRGSFRFAWVLASVAVLIVVLAAVTLIERQRSGQPATSASSLPGDRNVVTASLSPGVSMGQSGAAVQVALREQSTLKLILKLPGYAATVSVRASVSLIGDDGAFRQIWAAPQAIQSQATPDGQAITLKLGSELLQPGDYAVRVGTADETSPLTFLFRAVRVP